LDNERAALEYLTEIGSPLAPRFLAGSGAAGFLVTEDLGPHPSLLDILLGENPETAKQAPIDFARGLGRLHATNRH
jgi:aminoglycoside/choline kinase family phosphotransferase